MCSISENEKNGRPETGPTSNVETRRLLTQRAFGHGPMKNKKGAAKAASTSIFFLLFFFSTIACLHKRHIFSPDVVGFCLRPGHRFKTSAQQPASSQWLPWPGPRVLGRPSRRAGAGRKRCQPKDPYRERRATTLPPGRHIGPVRRIRACKSSSIRGRPTAVLPDKLLGDLGAFRSANEHHQGGPKAGEAFFEPGPTSTCSATG